MANYRMPAACVVRMPKDSACIISVVGIVWPRYCHKHRCVSYCLDGLRAQNCSDTISKWYSLQIKMVYLGCLIEAYADTKLLTELESNRNDQVYNEEGKNIMKGYMDWCKRCYNGDAAIAMERSRNRAQNYYEKNNTRGFFPMPNFKMWLSIFKIWVSSVGDLGIRGDGNFDFDFFFQFQRPWTIQKSLAVVASESIRKATQKS